MSLRRCCNRVGQPNRLESFADLQVGQKVEVDFDYRDGRHVAKEIERED